MKIVILDIDGVLNSRAWEIHQLRQGHQPDPEALDPANIANLNTITTALDAKIVVSSAWRLYHSFEWLSKHLKASGVRAPILDFTPEGHRSTGVVAKGGGFVKVSPGRHWEVHAWLVGPGRKYGVTGMVILDDIERWGHLGPWHVLTSSFSGGLSTQHVENAIWKARNIGVKHLLDVTMPEANSFWWRDPSEPDQTIWREQP